MKKSTIAKLIALAVLSGLFFALCMIKLSSSASEWFAAHISRKWIEVSGRVFGVFPFSWYELTLYALGIAIIAVVVLLIVRLVKRRFKKVLSLLIAVAITVFAFLNIYTISAGFNYNRADVALPGHDAEITDEEVAVLSKKFFEEFALISASLERDKKGNVVCPYTFSQLGKLLKKEYKRLAGEKYFSSYTPTPKKILSSRIMSEMHLEGVFFAPYGEVNLNPDIPAVELPVAMAHEMAHAKGVMREDEANMAAYYITCSSDDAYLRYCGYVAVYSRVLSAVHFDDELRKELRASIDENVFIDVAYEADFWNKYKLLAKITDFFNNLYLKLHGVKEGTDSYYDPDIIVPTPVPDGNGGTVVEPKYYYSELQKIIFTLLKTENSELFEA